MNDFDILVKTLFLEGGSTLNRVTSIEDLVAIGWNIRNRVERRKKRFGLHIHEVCLKHKQYSCWNDRKPGDIKIGDSFEWQVCKMIAQYIINADKKHNPIENATHYFNPALCLPRWASKMKQINYTASLNHKFYFER